jgi:hypothetical protein
LRWDFSFGCPFCLLHEAQVCPGGAAGSSQFWIEHLELQSERPDLRNAYSNLVYTCRRCNLARRSRSRVDVNGRRLLNPCADTWSSHYRYDGDSLSASTPDGSYTAEVYDINSPPKVALRRERQEAIDESLHVLATVPELLTAVMAGVDLLPMRTQGTRLDVAEQLHRALAAARRTLLQLSAIPHDANDRCACDVDPCDLSEPVSAVLLHIELEPGRQ